MHKIALTLALELLQLEFSRVNFSLFPSLSLSLSFPFSSLRILRRGLFEDAVHSILSTIVSFAAGAIRRVTRLTYNADATIGP